MEIKNNNKIYKILNYKKKKQTKKKKKKIFQFKIKND